MSPIVIQCGAIGHFNAMLMPYPILKHCRTITHLNTFLEDPTRYPGSLACLITWIHGRSKTPDFFTPFLPARAFFDRSPEIHINFRLKNQES